jgi:hypothetical protein
MKTISELQIEQYGTTISWNGCGQNVDDDLSDKDFWLYFNIDYKQCKTKELLSLLKILRVYQSRDKEFNNKHQEDLLKIINPIKSELSTREHIPNKKERKELLEKSQMFEQLSFKQIRALIWWEWFKPKKLNKFYEMLLIGKAARFAFEDAQRCS